MQIGKPFNPFGLFTGLFIPNCIAQSHLKDADKLLLGRLYQYAGRNGKAFPSRKSLAEEMHWTLRKLDRAIASIKEEGLVTTHQINEHSPSTYIFLYHEIYEKTYEDEDTNGGTNGGTDSTTPPVTDDSTPPVTRGKHNKFINEKGQFDSKESKSPLRERRVFGQSGINRSALKPKLNPTCKTKNIGKVDTMSDTTLALLTYWNTFDSLPTHKLEPNKDGKLTKLVKDADASIRRLMQGTFYSKQTDLPRAMLDRKFSVAMIKKAIARIAVATTADYYSGSKISFIDFLYNPRMKLSEGRVKYRHKYPLVYFLTTDPKPQSERHTAKVSKYPILIDKVVAKLSGDLNIEGTKYNMVVRQVEKAVALIDEKANGSAMELRRRLPEFIYDSLVEVNQGFTVEALPLGVYNLTSLLRKRLLIK